MKGMIHITTATDAPVANTTTTTNSNHYHHDTLAPGPKSSTPVGLKINSI